MIPPIGEMKRNNAFTLIEILLVIIIFGIVLALAAPNFSNGYSRLQLNKTADDFLSMSRWAQAMAIGQERIYVISFSDDHQSYGLVREKVDDEINEEINGQINGQIIDQISEQVNNQDSFEPVKGTLGRMHKIPDTIHIDTQNDRIKFYPDGTIDPATIQLSLPDQQIEISSTQVRGMMTKVDHE